MINYKQINEQEVMILKKDLLRLIDENYELNEMVNALQEVLLKIVNIKGK